MHPLATRSFAGDPFGLAMFRGNFTIQRHRRLHGDQRCTFHNPMIKRRVQFDGFLG